MKHNARTRTSFLRNNIYGGPLAEYMPLMAALSISVIFSIQFIGDTTGDTYGQPKEELPPDRVDVPPDEFLETPIDPTDPNTPNYVCSGFACRGDGGRGEPEPGYVAGSFNDPEIIANCPPEGITWDYNPYRGGSKGSVKGPGQFFGTTHPVRFSSGGQYFTLLADPPPSQRDTMDFPPIVETHYYGKFLGMWNFGIYPAWAYVKTYEPGMDTRLSEDGFCPNVNYPPASVAGAGNYPPYYDDGPLMGLRFLEGTPSFDRLDMDNGTYDAVIGFQDADTIDDTTGGEIIIPGPGNDFFSSDGGADTYVYKLGDGSDNYRPRNSGSGTDTVHFLDIASTDVDIQSNGGTWLTLGMPDGGRLTLEYLFNSASYRWVDELRFTDTTFATAQSIRDWVANSRLPAHGTSASYDALAVPENHVYEMAEHGTVSIYNMNYPGMARDSFTFADVARNDVTMRILSNRETLRVTLPDGETATLSKIFDPSASERRLIDFSFSDGAITHQELRDKAVMDAVAEGGRFYLTHYPENIVYTASVHPSVSTESYGLGTDNDTLTFTETDYGDAVLRTEDYGRDLRITLPDGDTFLLIDHFNGDPMETISFADGTTPTLQQQANKAIADQLDAGASSITMSQLDDDIVYDPTNHGSITFYLSGNDSSDVNTFETTTPWADVEIWAQGSVDARIIFPDGDVVRLNDQMRSSGNRPIDTFTFDGVSYTRQDFADRVTAGSG